MPKTANSLSFRMNTLQFCQIWKDCLDQGDNWSQFIGAAWEHFSIINQAELNKYEKGWDHWDKAQIHTFLSERCYTKAMGIRATLRSKTKSDEHPNGVCPDMVDGYKHRNGPTGAQVTTDELLKVFGLP